MKMKPSIVAVCGYLLGLVLLAGGCREKQQSYAPIPVVDIPNPTITPSAATVTRMTQLISVPGADTVSIGFIGGGTAINLRLMRIDTAVTNRVVVNGTAIEVVSKVNLGTSGAAFKAALVNFRFGNTQAQARLQTNASVYNPADSTLRLLIKIPSSFAPVSGSGSSASPLVLRYAVMNSNDSISNVIEEPVTILQAGGAGANFLIQKTWHGFDFNFSDTINCGGTRSNLSHAKTLNGITLKFNADGTANWSAPITHIAGRCNGNTAMLDEIPLSTVAGWTYNNTAREITVVYQNSVRHVWYIKTMSDAYFEVGNQFDTDAQKFRYRFNAKPN